MAGQLKKSTAGWKRQDGGFNLDLCWPEQTAADREKYVCLEHLRVWPHDAQGLPK